MANATVSKVTKVEKLSAIIDALKENEIDVISIKGEDVSAIDTLQHEINLNKSKAEKSKSKKAVDNSDWETKIVEALEGGKVVTPTELMALIEAPNTQKVSAVVKGMGSRIITTKKGKKTTYELA